jgi:MocE subfamily Rieske [2Fe-2S] domain protein
MTGLLQHIGLADNVVDHRLNTRTVYMNPISRWIYWNMNYHVEHHMFPMVPYHALPRLHDLIKHDLPTPNPSMWHAYREVWPVLLASCATRILPQARTAADGPTLPHGVPRHCRSAPQPSDATSLHQRAQSRPPTFPENDMTEWVRACAADDVDEEDVIRFDHAGRTFAIYRSPDDEYFATDGLCTHEKVHLADGLVMDDIIECPKHNGRFNYKTGEAKGAPVCVNLATYPVCASFETVERMAKERIP